MGAKAIPHLTAKLEVEECASPGELMLLPFDGLPDSLLNEPGLTAQNAFDAGRSPREAQGPARLLVSDQLESLLGWYV